MLIILHHLILIIKKDNFLILGEGQTGGINDKTGAAKKKLALNLGVASIAKLLRETSPRRLWVGGFSRSTHPWQFDTF